MEEEGPYRLVQSLHAHDGPIRSITIGPNGEVVTGCQSNSPHIRGWNPVDYSESFSPIFHDHWVTALGSLPADSSRSLFPAVSLHNS